MVRISGCKGLKEEICTKSPHCKYLKGKKRYCRLSHHMNARNARRLTQKNKVSLRDHIQSVSPNQVHVLKYQNDVPHRVLSNELNQLMTK